MFEVLQKTRVKAYALRTWIRLGLVRVEFLLEDDQTPFFLYPEARVIEALPVLEKNSFGESCIRIIVDEIRASCLDIDEVRARVPQWHARRENHAIARERRTRIQYMHS